MARKKVEVPTREELSALVDELNNILGLDPAIKVSKKTTDEELIEKIKEIATDNVYESDCTALSDEDVEGEHFYSEDAVKVFGMLGIEIAAGSPPEAGIESATDAEEAEEKTPAKGKKEKAAPAEKPAKEKKEKAPAKEKVARYSRANAFADAVVKTKADKKAVKLDDLADAANSIYMEKGNKDNIKEAKWYQGTVVPALVAMGVAEVSDGSFKMLV